MKLGSVQPGDLVRAGGMVAVVVTRHHGHGGLTVRGLVNGSTRRVKATEVEAIWLRYPRRYK